MANLCCYTIYLNVFIPLLPYGIDIDECVSGEDNCDDERGYCNNTEGSFECACRVGYSGEGTEGNCTGID